MTSNFPIINFPLLIWEFALIISELQFDISHMIIDTFSHSSISDITYLTIWFTLFSLQLSINFPQTNSRYDAICHISIYSSWNINFALPIWYFAYEFDNSHLMINFPHFTFDNFQWEFPYYKFRNLNLKISHMKTIFPSMNFALPIWHNFPQLNFRYLRFDNLTHALFPAISIRFSSLKFERWRFFVISQ